MLGQGDERAPPEDTQLRLGNSPFLSRSLVLRPKQADADVLVCTERRTSRWQTGHATSLFSFPSCPLTQAISPRRFTALVIRANTKIFECRLRIIQDIIPSACHELICSRYHDMEQVCVVLCACTCVCFVRIPRPGWRSKTSLAIINLFSREKYFLYFRKSI